MAVRWLLLRWGNITCVGFRQNHIGTGKTFLGGGCFCLGEAPPVRGFGKIALGRENLFGWRLLLRWGSTTRRRFGRPDVFSAKTRRVLLVPTHFWRKRGTFWSPRRIFGENARRFGHTDMFSAKTRGVLVALAHKKRATFRRTSRVRFSLLLLPGRSVSCLCLPGTSIRLARRACRRRMLCLPARPCFWCSVCSRFPCALCRRGAPGA